MYLVYVHPKDANLGINEVGLARVVVGYDKMNGQVNVCMYLVYVHPKDANLGINEFVGEEEESILHEATRPVLFG